MRRIPNTLLGLIFIAGLGAACSPSNNNDTGVVNDMGTANTDAAMQPDMGSVVLPDGNIVPITAGTCEAPVDLDVAGMREGMNTVYRGSTEGAMNILHPAGGCTEHDTSESVLRYTVPAGVTAVKITTEGSSFDTVVYVRNMCAQTAMSMDEICNNDNYDHSPTSTVYMLGLMAGQQLNIIVDGYPDGTTEGQKGNNPSSGDFMLTVSVVALGTSGNPCRPMEEGVTTPRCDAPLGCSEGGSPDGTAICVPVLAVGMPCDARGFQNTCTMGNRCVSDPTPAEGTEPVPTCSAPGTAAGAPCRMAEPRCDGQLVCGSGDEGMCVRQLAAGADCDIAGWANRCATGLTCRAMGDAGAATCAP